MNSSAFKSGMNIYVSSKTNKQSWDKFFNKFPENQRSKLTNIPNKQRWLQMWLINQLKKNNPLANYKNLSHAVVRFLANLHINALKNKYPKFVRFVELLKKSAPHASPELNVTNIKYNKLGRRIWVSLHVKGKPETYLELSPKNQNTIGFNYGITARGNRGKGWGTTIRRIAANAARQANMRVVQLPKNLEALVSGQGTLPPSAGIMRKLGAVSFKNNYGRVWFEIPVHTTPEVTARRLKNVENYIFPSLKQ